MKRAPRLGLIVNPIAGMGGRVGLKGTDGDVILRRAVERGALPTAESRAALALDALPRACALCAGAGSMGERAARRAGFDPAVMGDDPGASGTGADDTRRIARQMAEAGVDLILFAGGDGTARNVCEAVGEEQLVLGIPAGVKIHSAVFGSSPAQAGALAGSFLTGERGKIREKLAEVMDIDESAYREGSLRARLFGYLRIPYERRRVQGLKAGSPASECALQAAIAATVADEMRGEPDTLWLLGAGTTTRAVTRELGCEGTLLGVDAYRGHSLVGTDLGEREILDLLEKSGAGDAKILVTPIGGQGFVFGRGSQQFSPEVIRAVGKKNLIILATRNKLHAMEGAPLLADTGDPALDEELSGYYRVVSGYRQYAIYPIETS